MSILLYIAIYHQYAYSVTICIWYVYTYVATIHMYMYSIHCCITCIYVIYIVHLWYVQTICTRYRVQTIILNGKAIVLAYIIRTYIHSKTYKIYSFKGTVSLFLSSHYIHKEVHRTTSCLLCRGRAH